MNFFCDSGGNIFHVDPENVYQGSANANTIYFIGAFASSCQVTVAFGLPNGVYTEPTLLTLVKDSETLSVNDKNGVKFNVWQVRLNGVVTENYGKVDLQFYVYGNGGNGQGACIASASSSFEVSKGVPITLPDDTNYPEESLLAQILAQLQRLQAQAAASTEAIEENTEAIVEVQKALEDKIKEFNGNLSGADARLQAEANGEVTIATIEINNPNTTLAFKNLEGMTEIDWGDGTINSELTHTYENLGVYYCRIYGLVSIGEEAFIGRLPSSNYTPITHIKISNKVTSIGDNAFTYTKLRSIEIPNSVTYIGSSFDSSHYLEKIVIPESVTYIDVGAFNMCANLKIVELKGAPPQQIYSGDIFSLADKLEKIIVPYGMVEAYKSASAWTDYATLIDCLVYQSDLDVSKAEIKEKITENREEINKDIKNLYAITAQGGLYTMLEVEQAFSSRETADGENIVDGQYTAPTKIQGDTVACENLLQYPYAETTKTENGITFTDNGDGSITANGTATADTWFRFESEIPLIGTYTLSGTVGGSKTTYFMAIGSSEYADIGSGVSRTYTEEKKQNIFIRIVGGATVESVTFYPMLNAGSTALPYQPYFTGLKNAYFKGIKSTGRNLLCAEDYSNTINGVSITVKDNKLTMVGTATRVVEGWIPLKQAIPAGTYSSIIGSEQILQGSGTYLYLSNAVSDYTNRLTFAGPNVPIKGITTQFITNYIMFYIGKAEPIDITADLMLNHGTTATAYEPYKEDTYEFPETLELGEWDKYDPQTGELTRGTGYIEFDGTEDFAIGAGSYFPRFKIYVKNALSSWTDETKIISNHYKWGKAGYEGRACIVIDINSNLWVEDSRFTTVEELKAHLAELYDAGTPLTVAYELATPTTEMVEFPTKKYRSWNGGSETLVQGDTDNSEYGAIPTVTTEYFKLTEV